VAELSLMKGMRLKGPLSEAAAACPGLQVPDAQAQLDRLVEAALARWLTTTQSASTTRST
jgi:hypothetical protein